MYDEEGRRFTDLFCGAGALNYGHNHPRLRQALLDYISGNGITHSLDMYTEAKRDFILDFQSTILEPRQLVYRQMFCGPTGTNAVEAAMKLARKVTGRPRIAAFTNGFHGMSLGALAATGSRSKRSAAGIPLSNVDRYPFDGFLGKDVDTIEYIQKLIENPSSGFDIPAAFLLETIQAEGGINIASSQWLNKLTKLAQKHGILVIIDDIQMGCGRTGKFFSFEEANLYPDIVCLSKSLSGYGLPMSLVLIKPEWDQWNPGEHNGTFRGHNLAFVTARAILKEWQDTKAVQRIQENGRLLHDWLTNLPELGRGRLKTRGRGLVAGIEFASGAQAQRVVQSAFEQQVVVETCGPQSQVVKLLPAINAQAQELGHALAVISRAIARECQA